MTIVTLQTVPSETLVVGVTKHCENQKNWSDFVDLFGQQMMEWTRSGDIATEVKQITKLPVSHEHSKVKRIIFVGLGDVKKLDKEIVREAFGLVGKQLNMQKVSNVTIWLDSFVTEHISVSNVAFLASEGIGLGYYTVANYKTTSNDVDTYLSMPYFVTEATTDEVEENFRKGRVYAEAVNEARTLVNLPPNLCTASDLAQYAVDLAAQYHFEIEVLDKVALEELGMGGILAVNQGSKEEPRLITIKYQGTDTWDHVLGLVGKGVTYDTGGYSLKPRESMVGMKGDMGGAAAVLGAMKIIGEVRPKKNVVAVIAATDNMISATAMKPDDVITTYSGKTVEILNTDAEGRLVLADAVTYAKQQGATQLIDVATLTGGVIVALGHDKTGALTNDEEFFHDFLKASKETDEFVWRLPLTEKDKKRIRKSDMADLNNSPGRDGHMIFGGGFVGEFVENTSWIHLDIAGTSDTKSAYDLGPAGGTGVMVRTLANFVERLSAQVNKK